jgi:hypothetical protein
VSSCEAASAGNENASVNSDKWSLALQHLDEALRLLDEGDAPAEVGADLDMAIHRLRSAIDGAAQVRD